jgi:hypothetical protein
MRDRIRAGTRCIFLFILSEGGFFKSYHGPYIIVSVILHLLFSATDENELKDSEDLVTGDRLDLSNSVGITEDNTFDRC